MKKTLTILCAVLLVLVCLAANAEGPEPHGDGNGIVSRPLLGTLYRWLSGMESGFRQKLSFDDISNAVGKWGCVMEKSSEDTRGAYWTDGDATVTVTFRNRDGFWGVTSIVTTLSREEYENQDISFMPRIGNREAGSSPTEAVSLSVGMHGAGRNVTVTAEVPSEYWFTKVSFGEARYTNAPDEGSTSGASYMGLSFWPDEASLREDLAKGEELQEIESLYLLGMVMPGYTYTRYGMKMTDYIAELREDLWMRVSLYGIELYTGSEAEAILRSAVVQDGDYTFEYVPLDLGDVEGPHYGDLFSMDVIADSQAVAEGKLEISREEDNSCLYVTDTLEVEELAFSHDQESEQFYSYADFDIIVLHPDTEDALPLLRLWIYLNTRDSSLDVSSVTFTAMGKEYTFSELSDPEDFSEREGDYRQVMLIRFDSESMDFIYDLAMEQGFGAMSGGAKIPVVFHGTRDIEVEMGDNLWNSFGLYWELYTDSGATLCLDDYQGNPMEMELAE